MKPEDTSVFHAASPQAQSIAHLFYFDLAIAAVIFLTVAGLVAFIAVRFRHRPGAAEPYQDPGNPRLETLWTVVPSLILVALLVATAYTMHAVNPPVGLRLPDVVVVAHQWWWEYRYPQSGVVTANELHLPAGSNCLMRLESADVIHDFWVPDLSAKSDAIPGHPSFLWIKPDHPGVFLGTCAEYCGMCHGQMGIRVIVESPEEFSQWSQRQLAWPAAAASPAAKRGEQLFLGRTCMNCHAVNGTAAHGGVGPDLTHVAERQTLAANVLANTHSNLAQWIRLPQSIKTGSHMPNQRLTEPEALDLASYLEGLL